MGCVCSISGAGNKISAQEYVCTCDCLLDLASEARPGDRQQALLVAPEPVVNDAVRSELRVQGVQSPVPG